MTDTEDDVVAEVVEELSTPTTIPVQAYTSEAYARAERDKLWRKVWLQVGRVEEIPEVGGYLTYDILDDSIIVVRTGPNEFSAHHNVCMHRGRRLVDVPPGAKNACAKTKKSFVCGFHGWTYGLDGACTHIREQDDWQGALTPANTHLAHVNVDTWGGWLFVNMDIDPEPLADYLFPAAKILDPFGLQNMRFKWRKWLNFDCNWKVALEAFNETYHVFTTHPEFNKFGEFKGWAKAQGKHSNIGYDAPKGIGGDQVQDPARLRRSSHLDRGDAGLHDGGDQRHHHADTRQRRQAPRRRTARGHPGQQGPRALVDLGPQRRRRAWRHLADDSRRHPRPERHGLAAVPQLSDRSGPDERALLQRPPGPELRPGQVHLRGRGARALPERRRAADGMGLHPGRRPELAVRAATGLLQHGGRAARHEVARLPGTKPNPYRERSTVNLHYQLSKYMGIGAPEDLT